MEKTKPTVTVSKPTQTTIVKPSQAGAGKLTPDEIEKKKADWWARPREEKKSRERRKEDILESEDDSEPAQIEAQEQDEEEFKEGKKKQKNICRKYGIKQRQLRKAADFAKKLIASKMAAQFDSDCVLALVELMTRGDI